MGNPWKGFGCIPIGFQRGLLCIGCVSLAAYSLYMLLVILYFSPKKHYPYAPVPFTRINSLVKDQEVQNFYMFFHCQNFTQVSCFPRVWCLLHCHEDYGGDQPHVQWPGHHEVQRGGYLPFRSREEGSNSVHSLFFVIMGDRGTDDWLRLTAQLFQTAPPFLSGKLSNSIFTCPGGAMGSLPVNFHKGDPKHHRVLVLLERATSASTPAAITPSTICLTLGLVMLSRPSLWLTPTTHPIIIIYISCVFTKSLCNQPSPILNQLMYIHCSFLLFFLALWNGHRISIRTISSVNGFSTWTPPRWPASSLSVSTGKACCAWFIWVWTWNLRTKSLSPLSLFGIVSCCLILNL